MKGAYGQGPRMGGKKVLQSRGPALRGAWALPLFFFFFFRILKRLGCGAVMLAALVSMYTVTQSIIGTVVVTAIIGVRQGSPTTCLLFIIFVNDLIALIKSNCGTDGFLMWLHIVVLMDDTVPLSATRQGMEQKLILLKQYCQENEMLVKNMTPNFFFFFFFLL